MAVPLLADFGRDIEPKNFIERMYVTRLRITLGKLWYHRIKTGIRDFVAWYRGYYKL
jgi:hypothetical protein